MAIKNSALATTDDLMIKHEGQVHSGKVRSAYWLGDEESQRLIEQRGYPVDPASAQLGIMVTSDRISAFNVNWKAEEGLEGVPGKGATLNAVSEHWFKELKDAGISEHHVLDKPHPLVWVVERAKPIMVEAIARQFITGSMWRAYESGAREFCGISLPDGLNKDQRLDNLLVTPTTKGILKGIPGVPEGDDADITMSMIRNNYEAFGFRSLEDVDLVLNQMLPDAFQYIAGQLGLLDRYFVDTKFEFGYGTDARGRSMLMMMDEVGTPDSSRIWVGPAYRRGKVTEESKEPFRQYLLNRFGKDAMTNGSDEAKEVRRILARDNPLPVELFMEISGIYQRVAEMITGSKVPTITNARAEIYDALSPLKLVK